MDGGKLREAARKENDERILQIINKDCVAAEVKYHRRCYKRYVSPVEHINVTEGGFEERIYNKSFDSFCVYVKKNIIDDHNIFYMNKDC
jgi:hypothetical protein